MGEGLGEKIFYLTAKTITRTVAWQAFDILKEQALRMKVLVLTAKEKICFCEETNCNPEACPYAKGHYDLSLIHILFTIYILTIAGRYFQ